MTSQLAAEDDRSSVASSPPRPARPGRLTSEQAEALRECYAQAQRTHHWTELAVSLASYQADAVAQIRLGAVLGVSASHIHRLVERYLPTGHEPAAHADWNHGSWVNTRAAAEILGIAPKLLARQVHDAAEITCKAGPVRVWHAASLADWSVKVGLRHVERPY